MTAGTVSLHCLAGPRWCRYCDQPETCTCRCHGRSAAGGVETRLKFRLQLVSVLGEVRANVAADGAAHHHGQPAAEQVPFFLDPREVDSNVSLELVLDQRSDLRTLRLTRTSRHISKANRPSGWTTSRTGWSGSDRTSSCTSLATGGDTTRGDAA